MKKKFVIIDDSSFMRTILRKMVEESRLYRVVAEGGDGHEAVRYAGLYKPDVMTLDITMPDMDGITAVEEVLKVSPYTRIIMISAMGQQGRIVDAIKKGVKDFIIKPFEKERVIGAITKVLAV